MSQASYATVNVLGASISALNLDTATDLCTDWLSRHDKTRYICISDVHAVMESRRSGKVRSALNRADASMPDGMPLVWLGRLQRHRDIGRVHGPDLMIKLLKVCAEKGYTNYLYGGAPGVAEELRQRLQTRFPGLKIVGTHSPPYSPLTKDQELAITS